MPTVEVNEGCLLASAQGPTQRMKTPAGPGDADRDTPNTVQKWGGRFQRFTPEGNEESLWEEGFGPFSKSSDVPQLCDGAPCTGRPLSQKRSPSLSPSPPAADRLTRMTKLIQFIGPKPHAARAFRPLKKVHCS